MNKALYWSPRILAILFILFISLFSLDVFAEYAFPEVLLALFMHLIPALVLIVILIIAWKQEILGGIIFLLLGLLFTLFFKTYMEIITFILISFPVFLVGFLFILSKKRKKKK